MNHVFLSVILPCYNQSKLLQLTFEHLLNQHTDGVEWIFVNDGSTDDSLQILNDFKAKHNFIQVFDQENKGPGSARNFGAQQASGQYFIFLDPDDFWKAGFLKEIVGKKGVLGPSDLCITSYCFSNRFNFIPEKYYYTLIEKKCD